MASAARGMAIRVRSMKQMISSWSFTGSLVASITVPVSEKKMICTMETMHKKHRADSDRVAVFSEISSTGRNISAMPTGMEGAMAAASGTCRICSRGWNTRPIHWKSGVYSARIMAETPMAASIVRTWGITCRPSFRLMAMSLGTGFATKARLTARLPPRRRISLSKWASAFRSSSVCGVSS